MRARLHQVRMYLQGRRMMVSEARPALLHRLAMTGRLQHDIGRCTAKPEAGHPDEHPHRPYPGTEFLSEGEAHNRHAEEGEGPEQKADEHSHQGRWSVRNDSECSRPAFSRRSMCESSSRYVGLRDSGVKRGEMSSIRSFSRAVMDLSVAMIRSWTRSSRHRPKNPISAASAAAHWAMVFKADEGRLSPSRRGSPSSPRAVRAATRVRPSAVLAWPQPYFSGTVLGSSRSSGVQAHVSGNRTRSSRVSRAATRRACV